MYLLNRSSRSDIAIQAMSERKVRALKSRVVANGDRSDGNVGEGKVSQKLCLSDVRRSKSEKSAITSAVSGQATGRSGKPHPVQGMHGEPEIGNGSLPRLRCRSRSRYCGVRQMTTPRCYIGDRTRLMSLKFHWPNTLFHEENQAFL